jgi:hypothetical protein
MTRTSVMMLSPDDRVTVLETGNTLGAAPSTYVSTEPSTPNMAGGSNVGDTMRVTTLRAEMPTPSDTWKPRVTLP